MPIEKLIRRPAKTLSPDAMCEEAARLMRDENIGAVVVEQDGRPLGVVTDRDIVLRVVASGGDPGSTPLRQVMSGQPVFLSAERGLDQLIRSMRDMAVRRVPIVDAEGRLRGLVSLDDLLILLSDQIRDLVQVVRDEVGGARS